MQTLVSCWGSAVIEHVSQVVPQARKCRQQVWVQNALLLSLRHTSADAGSKDITYL